MSAATIPTTFKEAEVILAEALDGYEPRPQQQTLARNIETALDSGQHLIAQAGCGTGKSVGYLIPAIQSGKRTVVTTATKALQDQIASKDLPFLAEHLGVPFTHAVLKGRSNYACQAKLVDADTPATEEVKVWIKEKGRAEGFDGERENIPVTLTDKEWRGITVTADECPGKRECPFGETCYAEAAKARAKEADVVVVNHALFFTDLMVKTQFGPEKSMLDAYDVVVADEAHELEEWASNTLGQQFSEGTINSLMAEVRNLVMNHLPSDDPTREAVLEAAAAVSAAQTALFAGTYRDDETGETKDVLAAGRLYARTFLAHQDEWVALANSLGRYADAVSRISVEHARDAVVALRRKRLLTVRSINTAAKFADLIVAPHELLVRWVEEERIKSSRGGTRKVIKAAPIEVGDLLKGMLWDETPGILVSATMSVQGKFDYIAGRLGIGSFHGIDVGTPFDYEKQSRLYVPDNSFPSPQGNDRQKWEAASTIRMGELVKASDGRALLLFTSRKQMENAYETLSRSLPYTCLMQGQEGKSNKALAAEFMADTHSVLFALRSFFTGVDFQGEACSLVVIDKLPFPVPTEPVTQARCELIENRGGNSFRDYTIPVMSLILEQGFGRLIRHRNDKGVVAILDSRLAAKPYGRDIIKSLPPAPLVRDLDEVRAFYEAAAA